MDYIIGAVIFLLAAAAVRKLIKDRRAGKTCGGCCSGCPMGESCVSQSRRQDRQ